MRNRNELLRLIREAAIEAKGLGIARESLDAIIRSEARRRQGFAKVTPVELVDQLTAVVDQVYR